MFKIKLTFLFLLVSNLMFAQVFSVSFKKKEYFNAILNLETGEELQGLVKNFYLPNVLEIKGMGYDFKDIEKQLKLHKNKYKFKEHKDSKIVEYTFDQVKSITIYTDEDTLSWEKIKLKKIDHKYKVEALDYSVMVPVISAGKINVYGFKVYETNFNRLIWFLVYIKNQKDDYGYIPFDYNQMNVQHSKEAYNLFYKAFELAGQDCEAFLDKLNQLRSEDFLSQGTNSVMSQETSEYILTLMEESNKIKNSKLRAKYYDDGMFNLFLKSYFIFTDAYEENCP